MRGTAVTLSAKKEGEEEESFAKMNLENLDSYQLTA